MFSEKLYQSFLKLNANILHCSLFDVLRLLLPMLAQGRLPFICQRIDSAVGELIKLCLVDFESMNNIPEDSYNIFFLESVLTTWDDYCSFLVRCQEILAIMNSEEWSVMQVGFTRWRNDVINSSDMGVPNVALQLIQKHRNGSAIDTSILLGVTRMLSQLDVYAESFENRFLADTICHYKLLSNELSVLLKGPDHIAAFFLRISEEIDNCSAYLVGDTNQKLITLFRGLLLGEHFIRLKTILVSYDDDSDQSAAAVKELSVIYDILEGGRHGRDLLIPGLKYCFFAAANSFKCSSADLHLLIKYMTHCKMLIQNAFKGDSELIHAFYNSLSGAVNSSVFSEKYPKLMAEYVNDDDSDQSAAAVKELSVIYDILEGDRHGRDLLIPGLKDCFFAAANSFKCSSADLHLLIKYMTHCKMLIQNAFKGDSELIHAFYNSLSGAVNSSVFSEKYPKLMAEYVNEIARAASQGNGTLEKIDNVKSLLPFLDKRQVFEEQSRLQQSVRVCSEEVNYKIELFLVDKLEAACSYVHNTKSSSLVHQAKESARLFEEFRRSPSSTIDCSHGSVQVFTPFSWVRNPTPNLACKFPTEMTEILDEFRDFYLQLGHNNEGHLRWQTDQSSAVLIGYFEDHEVELVVSGYEMCILMLFNSSTALSFEDIRIGTGIEIEALQESLDSLCQIKLLERIHSAGELFSVNPAFQQIEQQIVDVPELDIAEVKVKSTAKDPLKLEHNRRSLIKASLIKFMSIYKVIHRDDLAMIVKDQLKKEKKLEVDLLELKPYIDNLPKENIVTNDEDVSIFSYVPYD